MKIMIIFGPKIERVTEKRKFSKLEIYTKNKDYIYPKYILSVLKSEQLRSRKTVSFRKVSLFGWCRSSCLYYASLLKTFLLLYSIKPFIWDENWRVTVKRKLWNLEISVVNSRLSTGLPASRDVSRPMKCEKYLIYFNLRYSPSTRKRIVKYWNKATYL